MFVSVTFVIKVCWFWQGHLFAFLSCWQFWHNLWFQILICGFKLARTYENITGYIIFNTMVNPESSHVRMGWISVISVDFSVISVDFSVISVDSSVISVDSKWFQLIPVWFQISLLWNHTAVWFQISPLGNHTLNMESNWNHPESTEITLNQLKSCWIKLKSNLMIQGFNPCIKRKSHCKLVRFFLNLFYQLVGRCILLNHHEWRECNDRN